MGKYIHLFENESAFDVDYHGDNYLEPWVSLTEDIERVDYNKVDYSKIPLTFEILSDGNIGLVVSDENAPKTKVLYSINNGVWTELIPTNNTTFPVVNGDVVQFKGDNPTYGSYVSYVGHYTYFNSTCNYRIKGNIMSLIDSTNFASLKELQSGCTFYSLFRDCTGLTDASELLLPATTLTYRCYYGMFSNCSGLTQAPELPAPTLTQDCYFNMFYNCTSLTTAPALPATTLADYCYASMFRFCRNLNYIKCLTTNISATGCINNWVDGVASTGTFVTPSSTFWTTGGSGIPTGWTRVNA